MAQQFNRKFSVPHFAPASGQLIRGSQFVGSSAKYLTFFGPGQIRDDSWSIIDVDIPTQTYIGYHANPAWQYTKPIYWRPYASLLIPPQVVNLNVNCLFAFNNWNTEAARILGINPFTDEANYLAHSTKFTTVSQEQTRLVNLATQAAVIINTKRPGKTWVQVNDFYAGSVDNGGVPGGDDYPGGPFNDQGHTNVINNPANLYFSDNSFQSGGNIGFPLDVPSPFVGQFYGTDFLGILLGDYTFRPVVQGTTVVVGDFYHVAPWLLQSDALLKTVKSFHRYSELLCPCDIGTNLFHQAAGATTAAVIVVNGYPPPPTLANYTADKATYNLNPDPRAVLVMDDPSDPTIVDVWISDPLGGSFIPPAESHTYGIAQMQSSQIVFGLMAAWASTNSVDIVVGQTTKDITDAGSLVRLIANHFNFDPDTGQDLG